MRFVLEEASWGWDGSDREAYIERVEQLLDRLDVASERGEPYAASSELLKQEIITAHTLVDLFWNPDSPLELPFEVAQRITAHFNVIRFWDDEVDWPAIEVRIVGREVLSPSAALAHARVGRGEATACLPLPGCWRGPCEVTVGEIKKTVHFVVDEPTHRAFFRDALEVERADEAGLEALTPHAFPALFFLEGVWDGLRHLQGGYARVRKDLHNLLAVLDDHGAWVFTDDTGRLSSDEPEPKDNNPQPVSNQIIERRLSTTISRACRDAATLVPVTRTAPTPAPAARDRTASRSPRNALLVRLAPMSTRPCRFMTP
jgi:hypothetical protein